MSRLTDWYKDRAKHIRKDLHRKYGAGWALMSEDQRKNAEAASVLDVIFSQDMDKYEPAQALATGMMDALDATS